MACPLAEIVARVTDQGVADDHRKRNEQEGEEPVARARVMSKPLGEEHIE